MLIKELNSTNWMIILKKSSLLIDSKKDSRIKLSKIIMLLNK